MISPALGCPPHPWLYGLHNENIVHLQNRSPPRQDIFHVGHVRISGLGIDPRHTENEHANHQARGAVSEMTPGEGLVQFQIC